MKLINDDCLDYMKTMEDNSVDLTFTSPPYNMNLTFINGKYIQRNDKKHEFRNKYNNDMDNMTMEEYYQFNINVIDQLLRISNIVFYNIQPLTGNKLALWKLFGHYSENIKELFIWDKAHGIPAMNKGVVNSQYELIIIFDKNNPQRRTFDKYNFERGQLNNVWKIKRQRSKLKGHGATFPTELCEKILENFTNENDIIFDPFMGSGTLGVVANKLNRKFIGIERDKEYYDFAVDRINNTQTGLF